MKSIKPGRGPSMLGAIVCIALIVFGILWVVMASDITSSFPDGSTFGGEFTFVESDGIRGFSAPMNSIGSVFPLFGLVFVAIAVVMAIYHFKNANSKNRYSTFDIVDGDEEPDPLNERFGNDPQGNSNTKADAPAFCPYCGNDLKEDHIYCDRCGKKVSK